MHSVFRTVFLLAAAIAACTAGVLSESTPRSDSNRDLLLVVNKGDQTLGIVDPESGLQLAPCRWRATGHEVPGSVGALFSCSRRNEFHFSRRAFLARNSFAVVTSGRSGSASFHILRNSW